STGAGSRRATTPPADRGGSKPTRSPTPAATHRPRRRGRTCRGSSRQPPLEGVDDLQALGADPLDRLAVPPAVEAIVDPLAEIVEVDPAIGIGVGQEPRVEPVARDAVPGHHVVA